MRTLGDCVTIIVELRFCFFFFSRIKHYNAILNCGAQRVFIVYGSWRIFHKLQFQHFRNYLNFEKQTPIFEKTKSDARF